MTAYELRGDVAVITIVNPPVNALGPGVLEAIVSAVARAEDDPQVRALVLVGAGETFVAGADINIFKTLATREQALHRSEGFHADLMKIEDGRKPSVAAIHGNALGGGLELAMACHFRVALATARVGQPEVLLGLIPGAGGTQRLPRLCGVPIALDMCVGGAPVGAAAAHAAGIVDELVTGERAALIDAAVAFARARADARAPRRTRDLRGAVADLQAAVDACDRKQQEIERTPTPVRAPTAAINAIRAAATLPFGEGSAVERNLFADCLVSIESRALIHLFFAEREAAKVPVVSRGTAVRGIKRAAVVGAGTMGGGIAMAYANAGIPVLLKDVDEAVLSRGMETIRRNYAASVSKGRMTADALERAMALITPVPTYDGFENLDVVVEAVFEDLALKTATFADLGRVTRSDCLLVSNTSTLDIDRLAGASGRGADVVGHHFFSPANEMKLVEIVRGAATSPGTIATSLKLVKRLGKVGVVVGNCFGFVANRLLLQYLREAYLLLEEGASVPGIDRVMTSFGMPVGPFAMEDIAGIDVGARNPLIDTLIVEAGKRRRDIADEEILERLTTSLVNEGARVLEDGYATRASDIDVIYCYGFGFPRYRGGPMFYGDTVGLPTLLARVRKYAERFGQHWKPAPLLEQLVAEGRGFYTRAP